MKSVALVAVLHPMVTVILPVVAPEGTCVSMAVDVLTAATDRDAIEPDKNC
jgi:hypothetical protein